ncbi:MAG: hypothetical protein SF339_00490 [Blastocatellia bacterium]|nr:hypothetical protein [Blastocatellia bacterium]
MDAIDIRQYLLGQLPDDRQARVEEEFMVDDGIYTDLLVEEDEIIDDYLRGGLNPAERDSFERYFLAAPERRQKLAIARSFHAYIDARRKEPVDRRESAAEPWWRKWFGGGSSNFEMIAYAPLAATVIIAVIGGTWMYQRMEQARQSERVAQEQLLSLQQREMDLRKQVAQAESALTARNREAEARQSAMEQEIAQLKQQPSVARQAQTSIPVFAILPFSGRAAAKPAEVKVPSGATFIVLDLGLEEDDAVTYEAALLTDTGEEVRRWSRLTPDRIGDDRRLQIRVPTTNLRDGDYSLRLWGVVASGERSEAGRYDFTCKRLRAESEKRR